MDNSVHIPDYSRSCQRIVMKFFWRVGQQQHLILVVIQIANQIQEICNGNVITENRDNSTNVAGSAALVEFADCERYNTVSQKKCHLFSCL